MRLSRRSVATAAFIAGVISLNPVPAEAQAPTSAPNRPNVILILADDLGYGDLGAYGQTKIRTPHLDALASNGLRFTQAYAGAPVCAPSRSSLLTGLNTGRTPIRGNPRFAVGWDKVTQGDPPLPADAGQTLGQRFKAAGYDTAVIGKWGMGNPDGPGGPARHGFDAFFGYNTHTDAHNYRPNFLWWDDKKVPIPDGSYTHDLFAAETLNQIDRAPTGRPFFLYLAYTLPHAALNPPDLSPYENENWPKKEKAYAAMVTRLDTTVGQIVATLKQRNLADNTLILFAGDNGPHSEGHSPAFFDSNGPLRGIKRDVYEGGIRVPFIAAWPALVKRPRTIDTPVAFWDLVPTAADLLSQPAPAATDGQSLLPLLTGHGTLPDRPLYWEFDEVGGQQAVRLGQWKAVRRGVSAPQSTSKIELYDLGTDVGEQRDVSAEHADVVERLRQLMDAAHTPSERWPLTADEFQKAGVKPPPVKNDAAD